MASNLKDQLEMAEKIHNATYTFNEEKSKVILEQIKKEIQERQKDNIRVECKCCSCRKIR